MIDRCPPALMCLERLRAAFSRLLEARQGVAAVEFAMLAPLFIFIYLMAFQMTIGFSTSNRVARAAATIADIATQAETTDTDSLTDLYDLSKAIMAPYSTANLQIKVSGITIDANGDATIDWSWKSDNTTPYTEGDSVTVPDDLQVASSFLVHAEVKTIYNFLFFAPYFSSSKASSIDIYKDFYFRQRVGDSVTCSDC